MVGESGETNTSPIQRCGPKGVVGANRPRPSRGVSRWPNRRVRVAAVRWGQLITSHALLAWNLCVDDASGNRSRTLKPKRERRLHSSPLLGQSQSMGGRRRSSGSDLPQKGFWWINVTCSKSDGDDRLQVAMDKSPAPPKLGWGSRSEGESTPWHLEGKHLCPPIAFFLFCSPQGTRGRRCSARMQGWQLAAIGPYFAIGAEASVGCRFHVVAGFHCGRDTARHLQLTRMPWAIIRISNKQ